MIESRDLGREGRREGGREGEVNEGARTPMLISF